LNEGLLGEASAVPNIRLFFQHKISSVDFDERVLTVHDIATGKTSQVTFDFCVGADGSYSIIRRQLMRVVRSAPSLSSRHGPDVCLYFPGRMDFQQQYIPHEYIELKIAPGQELDGSLTFLLDPNHLHIWPRHSFMLIALPNKVSPLPFPVTRSAHLVGKGQEFHLHPVCSDERI